jgi:hypothetical protein
MLATLTTASYESDSTGVLRLREQLAERDEIIVALQHVIRDLRHEIENLRAEDAYALFARRRRIGTSSR